VCVNTKKWYWRKADLWAELGDEYHSAGKRSPQMNRQRMLAVGSAPSFGKGTVCTLKKRSFRECMVTWPDARKERVDGVYETDIGIGALI
jgi:hypothetical protein